MRCEKAPTIDEYHAHNDLNIPRIEPQNYEGQPRFSAELQLCAIPSEEEGRSEANLKRIFWQQGMCTDGFEAFDNLLVWGALLVLDNRSKYWTPPEIGLQAYDYLF